MVEIGSSVLRSPFVLGGSDDFQGNHTRGYETMMLMDMVLWAYLKTNKYVHAPGHHAALLNTWTSSQAGRSHMCTHSSQFWCSRKANKCEFCAIQPNNWYMFAAFNGGFWAGGSTKREILSSGLLFKQAPLISLSGPLKQCQMWYHPTLTSKGSVMSSVHL